MTRVGGLRDMTLVVGKDADTGVRGYMIRMTLGQG
jgi:hypothetical protein